MISGSVQLKSPKGATLQTTVPIFDPELERVIVQNSRRGHLRVIQYDWPEHKGEIDDNLIFNASVSA